MLAKIEQIENRYNQLGDEMGKPGVVNDFEKYSVLAKEYSDLEMVVKTGKEYRLVILDMQDTEEMLAEENDEELKEMAREELSALQEKQKKLEKKLQQLITPPDPNDSKNVVLEIRAGTGGDEAGIFAGDLYRLYMKYCEKQNWKTEIMDANYAERGGFKEIIFSISGKNVYGRLKFESGVHRVQRVPDTETQGRIHTSAASVAVLPEVADVEISVDPNDLRIDVYRASGHGGQHVNTTDSAVRIVHLPTGIMATCQDEKSQLKNKVKAMKVLKARIYDAEIRKQQEALTSQRRSMIRSGDRSEKIRTYNYPQGRVTDHRISLTLYRLNEVMEGDLDLLVDEILQVDLEERLNAEVEN